MSVVIETTIGDVTVDLYTTERPRCSMNFLKLCKMKYYNLNLLYSVERNFIAQTGDPTGTGKGGESIYKTMYGDQARFFEGEKLPVIKHEKLGLISMVSCGSHLFGSQFFLTLGEHLDSLDGEHIVFGEVVEGMDILLKLNQTLVDDNNRPYQDIRITHTVILEDPYPDAEELTFPDESPRPTREILESDYIAADEDVDDTDGKTMEEIQEEIAAKEAKARATILEMVGDLKDADDAPPENVIFVCKLNPVTTSEDLEIIFSRFGKIKSCEVIIDRITGNSLQYAFIEFEEQKSCEDAYFKMDNVLIDDRRIHVDFSQSVSKIKWRGKGKGVDLYDDSGQKIQDKGNKKPYNPEREFNGRDKERGKAPDHSRGHDRDYNSRDSRQHFKSSNRPWEKERKQDGYRDYQQNERGHRDSQTERQRERYDNRRYNRDETDRSRDDRNWQRDRLDMGRYNRHYVDNRSNNQRTNNETVYRKMEGNEKERKRTHSSSDDSAGGIPSDEEAREKMRKELKKSLKKKKKKNKNKSDSDSDEDSSEKESKKKKAKKSKKKKKKSISSDSESDSEPIKKKKKSKKKKKKKNHSESESSD